MHPHAFDIGPISIQWYGIMAALGFLTAGFILNLNRRFADMESDNAADLTFYAMLSGILGARVFYVIQFWNRDRFGDNLWDIIRIDKGGIVFYGGFIAATVTVFIYCRKKKLSFMKVADAFAPALAMGHALGRIGCFLNGCCFGGKCEGPLGVVYPANSAPAVKFPDMSKPVNIIEQGISAAGNKVSHVVIKHMSQPLHPVQLYEAVCNVIFFGITMFMLRKMKLKVGQVTAAYFFFYGLYRFCNEFFRGDHSDFLFGLFTPAQTIGFLMMPIGIIFFFIAQKKSVLYEQSEQQDKTYS